MRYLDQSSEARLEQIHGARLGNGEMGGSTLAVSASRWRLGYWVSGIRSGRVVERVSRVPISSSEVERVLIYVVKRTKVVKLGASVVFPSTAWSL